MQFKASQELALSRTKPLDIYIPGDNIEEVDETLHTLPSWQ